MHSEKDFDSLVEELQEVLPGLRSKHALHVLVIGNRDLVKS